MKTNKVTYVAMILAFIFMASGVNLMAQCGHGNGKGFHAIPDLTDKQKEDIQALKTPHMKQVQAYKADMKILRAEYDKLMKADKADMKAINAKIDEISKLHGDMMKQKAKHKQDVRALLTDAQRIVYDAKTERHGKRGAKGMQGHGGMKGHMHHKHGHGNCQGTPPPPPPMDK